MPIEDSSDDQSKLKSALKNFFSNPNPDCFSDDSFQKLDDLSQDFIK